MIIGAGGHGKVVAEAAFKMGAWSDIAFLDDNPGVVSKLPFPIIGNSTMVAELATSRTAFIVAIGKNPIRMAWLKLLKEKHANIAVIKHPSASISMSSQIGLGTVVLAGAVINSDAITGEGCIINTLASVDHDCHLAEGVHLSPGAHLGGSVTIGKQVWVGLGASIINNITIGEKCVIAAGATVIKDVPNNMMVAGVPAVVKKYLGDD